MAKKKTAAKAAPVKAAKMSAVKKAPKKTAKAATPNKKVVNKDGSDDGLHSGPRGMR